MTSYGCGGGGSGSGSGAAGYSYATLFSSTESPEVDARANRGPGHAVPMFSFAPTRKTVDRRYSPPPIETEKSSRHRAESGPPSSIFSGMYSPRNLLGKLSMESSRDQNVGEAQHRQQSRAQRRKSTTSRHDVPRQRQSIEPRYSVSKKHQAESKKGVSRQSFTSMRSKTTAATVGSRQSSLSAKQKEKKKAKASYGLLSCFGR